MNVLIRPTVNTMLETKFLRLRTPVELGSRFDHWQVQTMTVSDLASSLAT